jgi:hypothetical protein
MRKRAFALAGVFAVGVLATVGFGGAAFSAPSSPTFDRGLPTANLNNAAGNSRSNVAWSNGNDYVSGDDFTIGSAGQTWVVKQIRTWTVPSDTGGPFSFGDEYSSVSLYFGPGAVSLVTTGSVAPGSSVSSNPNIGLTPTSYAGGAGYQGSSGTFYRLWQVDFTNLALSVAGGQKYYFAVDGTPTDPANDYWFNHASNAALSGSPQQGADNRWVAWSKADLSTPNFCDSGAPSGGVCDGGWDKSSDINVQVFASQVATDKNACKKDGWQSLVRKDGSGFKNQGDCIQYLNTGK